MTLADCRLHADHSLQIVNEMTPKVEVIKNIKLFFGF